NVAAWDGAQWAALGGGVSGRVHAAVELPNGDLAVGGVFLFAGGAPQSWLARWNGANWSGLGAALDAPVHDLLFAAAGELQVGGPFRRAGVVTSIGHARLATACPADVATVGSGCAGSAGVNTLQAANPPWLGAAFATLAGGLPATGWAVSVLGFAASSVPLSAIHPQGAPGCQLVATPDLLTAHPIVGGQVAMALMVPNVPALAGLTCRQQVVALDAGSGGAFVLTSSNGLAITFGMY
ncbi:MAG: hypothetical protein WAT39_07420, partial [Planctomycetota bacterium]